ncbi:MAG TPA: 16S rRNA (adenine(1518)-N(6)/adenine(1519)-N(6))-dimethyltransferase RsmA [Polyangiaceae bacterium]
MTRDPRAVLREAGLRPKKSFGQNFLVASSIAASIAEACVHDDEVGRARVVEIGAGTGVLTRLLAVRARTVAAIERDRDLVPLLSRDLADVGARVVEADAQTVDLAALLGEPEPGSPRVLCGNLPYAITGPLLRRAMEHAAHVERVVFMLQDEVAERLGASPGTKEWGALTVFIRAAFDVRRVLRAPPGAFHPPPEVSSAVVELLPVRPPRATETGRFRALVRGAFGARRKTLRNAWSKLAPDPATLEAAAARAGVSLAARGETLDVEAFARMADALDRAITGEA